MITLSPTAATAVGAVLQDRGVPALRARSITGRDVPDSSRRRDPQAGAAGTRPWTSEPAVVHTEDASTLGPGEVAVTRGPATVYLPAYLAEAYPVAVLDLHRTQADPLALRLCPLGAHE